MNPNAFFDESDERRRVDEVMVLEVASGDDLTMTFDAVLTTDGDVCRFVVAPDRVRHRSADGCVVLVWTTSDDEYVDADSDDVMMLETLVGDGKCTREGALPMHPMQEKRGTRAMLVGALMVARDIVRARFPHVRTLHLQDESTFQCGPGGRQLRTVWMDVLMGQAPYYRRHLGARPVARPKAAILINVQAALARPPPAGAAPFDAWWSRQTSAPFSDARWLAAHAPAIRAAYEDVAARRGTWTDLMRALNAQHGCAFFVACEDALADTFGMKSLMGTIWSLSLDDLPTHADGAPIRAAIVSSGGGHRGGGGAATAFDRGKARALRAAVIALRRTERAHAYNHLRR